MLGYTADMTDGLHALAEETSLELHRLVAEALRGEPARLEAARRRVQAWLADGSVPRPVAEAWQGVLAQPVDEVVAFLCDAGPRARQLRQSSPFAGFLSARQRWNAWRRVRAGRRA